MANQDGPPPILNSRNSVRRKLLRSHMLVGLIGVLMLLVALGVMLRLRRQATRLATLEGPTVRQSNRALAGVQQSLAALRGWIVLGDESLRAERTEAWRHRIEPAFAELATLSDRWDDPQDRQRLAEAVALADDLEEWQWWIEDAARTPGNEPAHVHYTQRVEPVANRVLEGVTALIDLEKAARGSDSAAMLGALADFRFRFTACQVALALNLDEGHASEAARFRRNLAAAQRRFADVDPQVLSPPQREVWIWLGPEVEAFPALADEAIEIRRRPDWNLAQHWLATEAGPRAEQATLLLRGLSQSRQSLMQRTAREVLRISQAAIGTSLLLIAGLAGVAYVVSRRGAARITAPLESLTEATQKLAAGRDVRAIPVTSDDELGQLTSAFNSMQSSLQEAEAALDARADELLQTNVSLQQQMDQREQAEARFHLAVESSPYGTLLVDAEGNIQLVNAEAEKCFGYTREELLSSSVDRLVPERWRGNHAENRRAFLQEGKPRAMGAGRELFGLRKDGSEFRVEIGLAPVELGGERQVLAAVIDLTEREETRAALKEMTEQLDTALAAAQVGTWSWNRETGEVTWDDYIHPLFGLEPGTFSGRYEDFLAMLLPEDRGRVESDLSAAVEGGDDVESEFRVVWPDGSVHVVGSRGKIFRHDDGRPRRLTGVCWDVTDYTQTKEALRSSEERFTLAIRGSGSGIWDWNVTSGEVFYSARFKELLGHVEGDPDFPDVYESFESRLHPDDIERTNAAIRSHLEENAPYDVEYRLRTKGDDYRWFRARGIAIRDEEGRPTRMAGSITDIEDQKNAQAALGDRIRQATLAAEVGVSLTENLTLDVMLRGCTDAIVRNLDAAFARIWLLNEAEQVLCLRASSGLYTHLDGDHARVPVGALKIGKIASERKPHLTNAVIGDSRVNHQEWARREGMVAFAGYPLVVSDRLVGVMAMFARHALSDSTLDSLAAIANEVALGVERQQAEEALEQKAYDLARTNRELDSRNADLQQFAYVASHDLQEPLRAVASYCQLLKRRYADKLDDDAREFIEFAVDGATRMQDLIHGLLEFSRVGTAGRAFEEVDTAEAVDRALANLEMLRQESGAEVHHNGLPVVRGDRLQIEQLLQNLIGNALKYRGTEPPEVRIEAEREGENWRFAVRDNGIGIDPKHAKRIFVIFKRLHTRDEYSGTGIGLALCQRIVERHGGRIWVESESGRGSTFYFTLATQPPEPESPADEEPS